LEKSEIIQILGLAMGRSLGAFWLNRLGMTRWL
jgi:hypothetical protein